MPGKISVVLSVLLTIIFVILVGALSFFGELVTLNGYGDREGGPALVASLLCQVVGLILAALFAAWLNRRLIAKFAWNQGSAVGLAVLLATILGSSNALLSILVGIIVAEAIR